MDHATYLKNFSRIVRWTLPKAEAEAALADYREILDQYSQEHASDLVERLGTPEQAAELLMDRRAYHRWLTAFFVMLLCLLLPEWWLTKTAFFNTPLISLTAVVYVLFVLGAVAALVWFRFPASREKTPQPKGLLPTAVSLLVLFSVACGFLTALFFQTEIFAELPDRMYGSIAQWTLWLTGTAGAAAGAVGLVKARLCDRRWCALYLLGLTVLAECLLVLLILSSMSLELDNPNWWIAPVIRQSVLAAAGLVAAGVSLC